MLIVTQLIYVQPGEEAAFLEFEDRVLPLLGAHGGELLLRLRPEGRVGGTWETPYELHIVGFLDDASLEAFIADPERTRWLALKERAIRSAVVIRGSR